MGQPRLSQDEVNEMESLVKQGRSAPQILSQLQNARRRKGVNGLPEICKSLDQDCLASSCSGTRLGPVRVGGTRRQKAVWDVYKIYTTTIQQLYNNYTTIYTTTIQQFIFCGFLRNTHKNNSNLFLLFCWKPHAHEIP